MTKLTPAGLARTDFLRLLRDDPAVARERLEALVADPEALELYGEELAGRSKAEQGFAAYPNWDDFRRRILQEGFSKSAVDDATLALLAQNYDSLVELQFDLFSADAPGTVWARAAELVGEVKDCAHEQGELVSAGATDPCGPAAETTIASAMGYADDRGHGSELGKRRACCSRGSEKWFLSFTAQFGP